MLVLDDLLINGYKIYQDDTLYRFTSDAVLLSHFAKVKKNDIVADFCSGSGIIGINLFALHEDHIKSVTLVEMQKQLYDLSKKTIEYNNLCDKVFAVNKRVQDLKGEYAGKFSLITCNPPYKKAGSGIDKQNECKKICTTEIELPLSELIKAISYCLKFGGRTAICYRADRIADIIYQMKLNNIEPKRIQFVRAKNSDAVYLCLIEGVKGGKSAVKIEKTIEN